MYIYIYTRTYVCVYMYTEKGIWRVKHGREREKVRRKGWKRGAKEGRKEGGREKERERKRGGKKARLASVEEQTHRLKAVVASGRAGRATQRQSTQLDDSSGREHSFATATISSFRMTRYYKTPACVLATTRWSKSKHPPATTAAPASNRYLRDPRGTPPLPGSSPNTYVSLLSF